MLFGDPSTGFGARAAHHRVGPPSRGLSVLLPMLRARTVDELDTAVRDWVDPVNNLVSADLDGHLRYRTVGEIPTRAPANAWGPVPGDSAEHDWTGVVPPAELPTVRDPDVGYLVTANQEIVGPDYPHYLGFDYSRPDRAQRLAARVAPLTDATVDDMAAIHQDRRSLGADRWVERLTRLDPRDEHERAALDQLPGMGPGDGRVVDRRRGLPRDPGQRGQGARAPSGPRPAAPTLPGRAGRPVRAPRAAPVVAPARRCSPPTTRRCCRPAPPGTTCSPRR